MKQIKKIILLSILIIPLFMPYTINLIIYSISLFILLFINYYLSKILKYNNISLIHIAGADILTYSVIDFLDSLDRKDIDLSCCNNFKMCCGEGVCGSCTARFSGHRVKRFCKVQASPRGIFEGRRLI